MTVFKKTFISLCIAAIGFSAVLVIFSMVFMNYLYYELNATGLKNTAKTLYAAFGEDRVNQTFKEYSENKSIIPDIDLPVDNSSEYRLTLIEPSGFVLWDSHVTDLVNHLDREEIIAALLGKEADARRNSISRGNKEIYYAFPVYHDEQVIGVFRLSVSVPGFGIRVSPFILPFVIYSCILAIIVFWAIFVYSRSLADSVGRLVIIAQSSTPLLSDPEAEKEIAPEFHSLEKAMRAMTCELTLRFERAKAEGARLEAILNGMNEAVFAMDSELFLHLVNPSARKLFNINAQDINDFEGIKLSLLEATHSAELEDIAKKALAADVFLEMDLTLRAGVSEQNFQVHATKLTQNGGVILVLQDITRLVKLERVRKDFIANVSHELRTPIQLIKGFSETVHDTVNKDANLQFDDKKQILHFIEIIQKNANTMENLTNDLLVLSNLENNGTNSRETEEMPVLQLIEEAVSSVQLQAKRKNIEIITECPDDLTAKLYGSFIVQALINLIDNAIKYSQALSEVLVTAKPENGELIFEVCDKGIGIRQDDQERIFERFYRVDKARSKEAGGTGLGLSIVRHIVLLHKGTIAVESRAGEGSIFRIRIPL